jgi:hypothetical protein
MSDALLFCTLFVGLFVLRIVVATAVFFLVIPRGDRCPCCDAATLRVRRPMLERLLPFIRVSWCFECGWEGWLRSGPLSTPPSATRSATARSRSA